MPSPDLNLLIALEALLSEASVAGAARRLGLSTSAMSRTLSRLRSTTEDPLLVRAGRRMVLTPYAETLRERAHHTAADAQALLRPSTSTLHLPTLDRTFVLRANEGFIEAFGPALVACAAQHAPHVRLCFVPRKEKGSAPLRAGQVDLDIGVIGDAGPEIRLQALFKDRFVGITACDHPLSHHAHVTLEQYVAHGHVVASRHGEGHGPVDDALALHGLTRRVTAIVPNFQAVVAVTQASPLIGLVPASVLTGTLTVHAFPLPVETATITVSQMWHPRLEADKAHHWLRQWVRDVTASRRTAHMHTDMSVR